VCRAAIAVSGAPGLQARFPLVPGDARGSASGRHPNKAMELAGRGGSRYEFPKGWRLLPLALQLIAKALGGSAQTCTKP
jgi:hypothetical protein